MPKFIVIAVPTADHHAHPWVGPVCDTPEEAAEAYYQQSCASAEIAFDAMPSCAWHQGLIDAVYALKVGGPDTKVIFDEGDEELFLKPVSA